MGDDETIVALATPPGRGGVGIIRLSGAQSSAIAKKLTISAPLLVPRTFQFVSIQTQQGEYLDHGLLLYFKAPHSFTGEDVIEFQLHGSPLVLDQCLQMCVQLGARIARPGEFSERAFLNNKLDLTQAEAIADLINASSLTAMRMATRSLQGDFSKRIHALNQNMVALRMYVEAAIDFPEEEIDFISDGGVAARLDAILKTLLDIKAHVTQGLIVREGISIVIAGRPNAGKSTLINALAERDVAIVTDIPGTTRDVMRQSILIDDLPVYVIDTAGLRDSRDRIEQEGIKRAWDEVRLADCVLMVMDCLSEESPDVLYESIATALAPDVPVIWVFNKIDKSNTKTPRIVDNRIYLSAKSGEGLNLLKDAIKTTVGYAPTEGQFLARRRHLDALDKAEQLLSRGQHQLMTYRAGELLAEDLRLAHQSLCSITGEFTSDDLLGEIFSSFCIGK